tara:strand:+ start:292 stop:810 length:519 start_codon:yes stop_codon:yes gene_type:complete
MSKIEKNPDFLQMARTLKKDAIRYARVTGLNFFQDSFYNQGFTDKGFEKWENRKGDIDPGRKILVKSSHLLNSLDVEDDGKSKITFFSDAEYADIHNNGGTLNIRITEKSRKYFWYMYKATGQGKWKGMALTKKNQFTVVIPQRQFIGHSETLMDDLDEWLLNTIIKRFKTL